MLRIHKPSCPVYFDGSMCNSHGIRTICNIKSGLRSERLLRKRFKWAGQPKDRIEKASSGGLTYVTGWGPNAAILVVHDLSG